MQTGQWHDMFNKIVAESEGNPGETWKQWLNSIELGSIGSLLNARTAYDVIASSGVFS